VVRLRPSASFARSPGDTISANSCRKKRRYSAPRPSATRYVGGDENAYVYDNASSAARIGCDQPARCSSS